MNSKNKSIAKYINRKNIKSTVYAAVVLVILVITFLIALQ